MNVARYLTPELVRLGMVDGHLDEIDPEKNPDAERERLKLAVIAELCDLFEASGEIRNRSKFEKDFIYRERQSSTGLCDGVAIPHVRSMQPRRTVVVFARTADGVWFDSMDGEPTHLFFGITAPEYDDAEFIAFYKWISTAFVQEEWLPRALMNAEDEHEIIGILGRIH